MDIEEQYDKIYRYCYFKLYDKQLAQDITQEAFLRFYRQGLSFDSGRFRSPSVSEQSVAVDVIKKSRGLLELSNNPLLLYLTVQLLCFADVFISAYPEYDTAHPYPDGHARPRLKCHTAFDERLPHQELPFGFPPA